MIDESSKVFYQPWTEEGFRADLRVWKMTNLQRWIYRTLLQHAFVCSTRPRLPNDDEELWMMADCESLEQWLENKPTIIRMFEQVTLDDTPLLSQRRLEDDWARIQEIREKRARAGRKGGSAPSKS